MGSLKSDGTWNYYWKRGRELGSMVSDDTTWTYSYNGDGIRIGRTDGTNTYTYIYNGDKLTRVQYNGKLVRYNYDESGRPISLRYNNVLYFIDTNLQGDVVGIRQTSDNARVVNYVYDAYGKICSITGSMKDTLGVHNVLRYRGYVYDQETGLYYVSSRYYNPEIGRWISPEPNVYASEFDEGAGLVGYNVYAYCANNPASFVDIGGEFVAVASACAIAISATDIIVALIGVLATAGIIEFVETIVSESQFTFSEGRSKSEVDSYARPNQKKQGRENKNKARRKSNFKSRNNRRDGKPAKPKHHTPARDHQKHNQSKKTKLDLLYKHIM